MPEAIQTNCLRCTEKQRFVISRAIKRLKKEYPNIWEDMQTAWDPTGQKVKMFEQSLNAPRPNALPEAENEIVDRFGGNSPSTTTSKLLTSLLTSTLPPRLTPTTNSLPTRSVSQPQTTTTTTRTTRLTSPTLTTINHNYNHNVFLPNNAVSSILITEPLKKLTSLGNKVVATGSKIAGVVIDTVQNVVGIQIPKVRFF